jgi:hypothetical protein
VALAVPEALAAQLRQLVAAGNTLSVEMLFKGWILVELHLTSTEGTTLGSRGCLTGQLQTFRPRYRV